LFSFYRGTRLEFFVTEGAPLIAYLATSGNRGQMQPIGLY
jgi:hypothetical protein